MQNWRTSRCQAEIIHGVYQLVLFVSLPSVSFLVYRGELLQAWDTVGHWVVCPLGDRNGEKFHGLGLAGAGGSPCITVVESLALPSWWAAVTWIRKRAIFWWAVIISAASWIVLSPKDAPNDVVFAKRCPVLTSFYPSHHVVLITVVAVITVAAVTGIGNIQ
jgi:hypothetical protein